MNAGPTDTPFVVAIDQGTTATKVYRLDAGGRFTTLAAFEHRQIFPQPGWVEHDPLELLASIGKCLDLAAGAAGVGLANQGETVIAWDARSGDPIYNAIVWQDSRTQATVERLKAAGAEALTLSRAGLPLDPYFSATKLRWLIDHVDAASDLLRQGQLRLGTSDSFFLDRLCGRHLTDVTTASRTSLMNLATRSWDPELCELFGVPIECLPGIRPTVGEFGPFTGHRRLRLAASIVDQQAALFGHGCRQPGRAKITFGTGAFALTVAGHEAVSDPLSGMLPTVAWQIGDRPAVFAVDGGVYNAASAVNWVRELGLFREFGEIDVFAGPSAIERGVVFVPALSGLACPYWDRSAAGMWLGLGLETQRLDLCRAVLEGIALRASQVLAAMARHVPLTGAVSVDGGLSRNSYFCDFLARALGRPVVIPGSTDLTGLGTAQLALIGAGAATAGALPPLPPSRREIGVMEPFGMDLHGRFGDAVERCRHWR